MQYTAKQHQHPVGALHFLDRLVRIVTGAIMLAVVMTSAGSGDPLGWLSIVALLAIYPLLSGLIGWELASPGLKEESDKE